MNRNPWVPRGRLTLHFAGALCAVTLLTGCPDALGGRAWTVDNGLATWTVGADQGGVDVQLEPEQGSARLTIHFTAANQSAHMSFGFDPFTDLTGRRIFADVRVDQADQFNYMQLYLSSDEGSVYCDLVDVAKTVRTDSTHMEFDAATQKIACGNGNESLFHIKKVNEIGILVGSIDDSDKTTILHVEAIGYD